MEVVSEVHHALPPHQFASSIEHGYRPGATNDTVQLESESAMEAPTLKSRISLHSLSGGDQIELDMEHPITVADLKKRVAEVWHIPSMCQRIVAGVQILDDCDEIGDSSTADGEAISLTMLISLESVLPHSEQVPQEKVAGLEVLAELGARGGERALGAANSHLYDHNAEVRVAALKVLGAVATWGTRDAAIQEAISAMSDVSSSVRQEATRVLSVLAERGDMSAMKAVVALLPHTEAGFLLAAMEALKTTAEKGKASFISDVVARFKKDGTDAGAALTALGVLVNKGSKQASAEVVTLLIRSMDPVVQGLALKLLVALISKDDAAALLSVIDCLMDGDELAVAALDALANYARKGDDHVIAAVASGMEICDWNAWPMLVQALSIVTEEGDERPMVAVAAHLEAEEWHVRRLALLALGALLQRGDGCARVRALAALVPRMDDENALVRQAALLAFDSLHQ